MARSLARGGSDLILQNRTAGEVREALATSSMPAWWTRRPAAAAARTSPSPCSPNQAAVEAAWTGPDGLLAGARSGSVLVDMSTVPPIGHPSLRSPRRADAGAGILDAPVSGSASPSRRPGS